MTERIIKTEIFLREKLKESPYFAEHPEAGAYRLEHTFRVARIGASIARAEGMDEEAMTIACLLHDVSYCHVMPDQASWREHGRVSARIARPLCTPGGMASTHFRPETLTLSRPSSRRRAAYPARSTSSA